MLKTVKIENFRGFQSFELATTHSNDCWISLADIAAREKVTEDRITIQRIEREKQTGIAFTEREIVIAAQRGIEVR
ncbi:MULTISPECIES: hypothetical protein [Nostocales]|uniref:Uncharacterized protein n=2 Tax=Nostocales TaxID=1161 RepID=A0A0C1NCS0_9CYAN|nr:hypothetical protein [Tolypothrix bouteillei]